MKIIVYSFEKKANSTKRVTAALAKENTEMECVIKEDGCGIITPRIIINYGLEKAPVNFNYAYIPTFKRYYFVRDWTVNEHALWEGVLQEDFLATWKDDILAYSAYVLRSASKVNMWIPDAEYPATADIRILSNEIPNPVNLAGGGELPAGEGVYIVGINGVNETPYGSSGSVTYYMFQPVSMQVLCNYLMQDIKYLKIDWNDTNTKKLMTPELLKCLYNPLQYIASVRWFPDYPSDRGTDVNKIDFGFWQLDVIAKKLTTSELTETLVRWIPIPKHPQASSYGEWVNCAPYTSYQLHVSPFGIIDVPADELVGVPNVGVEFIIDYATGLGRIMVASSNRFIQILNFEYGASVQISQLVQQGLQMILSGEKYGNSSGGINGGLTGFLGGLANLSLSQMYEGLMGGIEAQQALVGDMINYMSPVIQSTGSNGARAWYYTGEIFWRMSGKFAMITDRGDSVMGRPLCSTRRLGDLSGFCLCKNASVEFEGNATEQDVVNAYLNRGFYIE